MNGTLPFYMLHAFIAEYRRKPYSTTTYKVSNKKQKEKNWCICGTNKKENGVFEVEDEEEAKSFMVGVFCAFLESFGFEVFLFFLLF